MGWTASSLFGRTCTLRKAPAGRQQLSWVKNGFSCLWGALDDVVLVALVLLWLEWFALVPSEC
jgi:hypothetical protein